MNDTLATLQDHVRTLLGEEFRDRAESAAARAEEARDQAVDAAEAAVAKLQQKVTALEARVKALESTAVKSSTIRTIAKGTGTSTSTLYIEV